MRRRQRAPYERGAARDSGRILPEMILGLIDGPADNKVQRCIIHQVIGTKRLDVSMSPEKRRERLGAPTTRCPGGESGKGKLTNKSGFDALIWPQCEEF